MLYVSKQLCIQAIQAIIDNILSKCYIFINKYNNKEKILQNALQSGIICLE